VTDASQFSDILHDIAGGDLPSGYAISCGNRRNRNKKQRHHTWLSLGTDGRNYNGGYTEGEVSACQVCGADQFHREVKGEKWKLPRFRASSASCC
jgi:hypothetical protein